MSDQSSDGTTRINGTCPECDGKASIYPSPSEGDVGHIYCDEDDCGWIHRNRRGISRFVDTGNKCPQEGNQDV